MTIFTSHHSFPFPFSEVAKGVWNKYPNEYSTHITSVDVLDRSFLPDGTLRTERLISIQQHAPRWIMKLMGGQDLQYVREVMFYKVPSSATERGMILMGSVNLTMSSVLICREQIRYQPSSSQSSHFFQHAHIQAQNSLAIGQPWAILGSKLESWACDRFASNAEAGRLGFYSVLNSMKKQQDERNSSSSSTTTSSTKIANNPTKW